MNRVSFSGRLGQDPKITETEKGPCATMQVANNERKDGQAIWVPMVAFGNKVAVIEKHLKKGDEIVVEGRIRMRETGAGPRYLEVEILQFKAVKIFDWGDSDEIRSPQPSNTAMGDALKKAQDERDAAIEAAEEAEELAAASEAAEMEEEDKPVEEANINDADEAAKVREENKKDKKATKKK